MTRNETRNHSSFGAQLKAAQAEKGLTNPKAATGLGVSLRVYQLWRSGKALPSMTNVLKLAHFYGKPLGYFLNGIQDREAA